VKQFVNRLSHCLLLRSSLTLDIRSLYKASIIRAYTLSFQTYYQTARSNAVISYSVIDGLVIVEMKFFAVIFLVTLLMMAAIVIQEVVAKECCE